MQMTNSDVSLADLKKKAKYSTTQVYNILGMDRERLRDWINQGLLKPTLPVTNLSSKAGFTYSDIFGIAIFKMLVEKGYKRNLVAKILGPHIGSIDSILDNCSFFLIMFSKDAQGKVVADTTAIYGSCPQMKITFDVNTISFEGFRHGAVSDWDDVEIINMSKLRNEVSQGIKKL